MKAVEEAMGSRPRSFTSEFPSEKIIDKNEFTSYPHRLFDDIYNIG